MDEERPEDGVNHRASEDADSGTPTEDGQLSGDLESLLEEEGLDDLEMEELFGEDEGDSLQRDRERQLSSREARNERRLRDRQEFRNLEGAMISGPVDLLLSEDRLAARILDRKCGYCI